VDARVVEIELGHLLEWQDKTKSTADFVRSWLRSQADPELGNSLEMRQLNVPPSDGSTTPSTRRPEPEAGSETFASLYITTVRRRRLGYLLLVAVFLGLSAAAGLYVYRGTLQVSLANDAGILALGAGDLSAAEAAWEGAIRSSPGAADARYGLVGLETLGRLDAEGVRRVEDVLERVPVQGYAADARRMRALASAHRAAGDYRQASLLLEAAMGRARQAERSGNETVPAALLWEAAELALLRPAAQDKFTERARRERARSYFSELASGPTASPVSDAAAAYVEWLDRETEGVLRAELYWRLGDSDKAWSLLPEALGQKGISADRLQRERLIWIYRALAEGRYGSAGTLLGNLGLLTGEPERRRQAQVASAAVLASNGRKGEARRKLEAALKATRDPEIAGVARLQVVLALVRNGNSPDWAAGLLEEAAVQIGDDHPDLIRVLALQKGERESLTEPESYPGFGRLAYDPRSGRLFPAGLSRGTPSGARLAPPKAFVELNRTTAGLAWPIGPAFHPISGDPLRLFFHPER
jgi:hypothetical protein